MKRYISRSLIGAAAAALFCAMAGSAQAVFLNPGFETGSLAGWSVTVPSGGSAGAVTSHSGGYTAVEGTYFAELKTDGPGSYTYMTQSFTMGVGDMLSGQAAFDYGDYHPYNDNAHVKVYLGATLVATPWDEFGLDHPNYWDGPWTAWSWTAAAAGTYTLQYGVANAGDSGVDSWALFDDGMMTPAIPEPSAFLLLGLGLIGVGVGRVRRSRKA